MVVLLLSLGALLLIMLLRKMQLLAAGSALWCCGERCCCCCWEELCSCWCRVLPLERRSIPLLFLRLLQLGLRLPSSCKSCWCWRCCCFFRSYQVANVVVAARCSYSYPAASAALPAAAAAAAAAAFLAAAVLSLDLLQMQNFHLVQLRVHLNSVAWNVAYAFFSVDTLFLVSCGLEQHSMQHLALLHAAERLVLQYSERQNAGTLYFSVIRFSRQRFGFHLKCIFRITFAAGMSQAGATLFCLYYGKRTYNSYNSFMQNALCFCSSRTCCKV